MNAPKPTKSKLNNLVPILELRRIEAAILSDVYDVVQQRHGVDEAEKVVADAVKKSAIAQGKSMRALSNDDPDQNPSFKDFAELMPLWEMDGALEIEMLHLSDERLEFNITRCKYSEMYREMGLGKIGHLLSCNRDGAFCIGYNPDMNFTRTKTIMQGDPMCDFRYQMKPQETE